MIRTGVPPEHRYSEGRYHMGDENIRNTGDESVVVNETGGAAEKKPEEKRQEAVKEKKPKK